MSNKIIIIFDYPRIDMRSGVQTLLFSEASIFVQCPPTDGVTSHEPLTHPSAIIPKHWVCITFLIKYVFVFTQTQLQFWGGGRLLADNF